MLKVRKFFPLREVRNLKWAGVEENHSPFDVRNFFSFLATPLLLCIY